MHARSNVLESGAVTSGADVRGGREERRAGITRPGPKKGPKNRGMSYRPICEPHKKCKAEHNGQ